MQEKQHSIIQSECVLDVLEGKQGKHIKEHSNYLKGRSFITITQEEVQELVNKYAGTGKCEFSRKGKWQHTEIIGKTDKQIGFVVDPVTFEEKPTTAFKIHYSKNGTHIVPCREDGDE